MKWIRNILNNKIFKFTFGLFKFVLTVVLLAMLLIIIVQRVSNNNIAVGGYRIFSVVTQSMEPEYMVGDILVAKEVKPSEVKVGDSLVYLGNKDDFAGRIVTHRVMHITEENGYYSYDTKGINNTIMDPVVSQDQIYGIVCYKTVFFSFLGELMSKALGYFVLCTIVAVMVSFQIVKGFCFNEEEENVENKKISSNGCDDDQKDSIIVNEQDNSKISSEGDVMNEEQTTDSVEEL